MNFELKINILKNKKFWLFGDFCYSIQILGFFFLLKNSFGTLIEITPNLSVTLGSMDIFKIFILQSNLEKKNKAECIIHPDFKLYYKTIVIKTV